VTTTSVTISARDDEHPPRAGEPARADVAGSAIRPRRWVRRAGLVLPAATLLLLLVGVWQVYADRGGLGPDVLPSPSRVATQGWDARADLLDNALPTLRATLTGFGVSLVVGFVISVLIDFSGLLRRTFLPLMVISQTLPIIVLAPLVVIWFGWGIFPKVLLVVLTTFFAITMSLVEGYAKTEPDAERLLRSMGASRLRVFRTIRLPTALPSFFGGVRISITYAVVGAVFAEYAGAENGLGIYMLEAKNAFRTDLVIAAVVVTSLLTLALFALTYLIERIALPWVRVARNAGRPT
jgi:ABC-type nitrate/sulfonate/bicarbonate transport system permease component